MTAEQGWVGEPQPVKEWNKSRASVTGKWVKDEQRRRRERGDDRTVTVSY